MASKRQTGFLTILAITAVILLLALAAATFAAYQYFIVHHPGSHLERNYIMSVLARESPIFAADKITRIGSFSGVEHRDYVTIDRIPKDLRQAIVSSEDRYFYRHPGFNPVSMAGAMVANLRARKWVRGGSTITQQTAKNLYRRQGKSLREKLRELLNALRLEAHYSKDEILEFYLNQFHVNANGRGAGVAARHFFDKDISELDLVECAFIAGSVQGPSLFDPFSTVDPIRRQRNLKRANARKDYVIRRMYEDGYLSQETYEQALAAEVPFRQGQFRFERSVIVDAVQRELDSEELHEILTGPEGSDLSSSGLQIYTSIDVQAQQDALYAIRSQLSRLKIMLEGNQPVSDQPSPSSKLERGDFVLATVQKVLPGQNTVRVLAGNLAAELDEEGIRACADPEHAHATANPGARAGAKQLADWLSRQTPGSTIPVIIRDIPPEAGAPVIADCAYPYTPQEKLQGALIALDDGFIRAIAGGFSNTDFNRALNARRQPGSAFKPIVYHAAIQLGWSPADAVQNRRDIYRLGNVVYAPKSDHTPPANEMSLAWIGTSSENFGSVWLLAHLTDKLTDGQFAEVAAGLGLGRMENESPQQTARRLRDRYGIPIRRDAQREAAFEDGRAELLRELLLSGKTECSRQLRLMSFKGTSRSELEAAINALAGEKLEARKPLLEADLELAIQRYENVEAFLADPALFEGLPLPLSACEKDDLERLTQLTGAALEKLSSPDSFDPVVWRKYRDYRLTVNVQYVIATAASFGIESPLQPVLSLPLGTSDVTLAEIAHFYETAGEGRTRGASPRLVTEIRDADGELVWTYSGEPQPVGTSKLSTVWLESIRNVTTQGTARGFSDQVTLSPKPDTPGYGIKVPFYGKTGTTNRYQNVYFVGLFPKPDPASKDEAVSPNHLFTIAAYAGYDDNRPLVKGRIRIYGSNGALPMVVETARGMIGRAGYPVDAGNLAVRMSRQLPIAFPADFATVTVNDTTGLPADELAAADRTELDIAGQPYLVLPGLITDGRFEPERLHLPLAIGHATPDIPLEDRQELENLLGGPSEPPQNLNLRQPEPAPEDREALEQLLGE